MNIYFYKKWSNSFIGTIFFLHYCVPYSIVLSLSKGTQLFCVPFRLMASRNVTTDI